MQVGVGKGGSWEDKVCIQAGCNLRWGCETLNGCLTDPNNRFTVVLCGPLLAPLSLHTVVTVVTVDRVQVGAWKWQLDHKYTYLDTIQ